jgi:hypothetical protein
MPRILWLVAAAGVHCQTVNCRESNVDG